MHRKFIRELYLGGLKPADSCKFETKEYEKYQREFTLLFREIQELLPEEHRKKLEHLCDAHTAMQDEVVIDAFVNGFKIGMNLAAESFYSEEK
ncbi:MAG: hypothetical protein OSJ43_10105 [Oscillospiraceae bacterium]|nr:hypothetical protein [Oscillospiraceae bacterium]